MSKPGESRRGHGPADDQGEGEAPVPQAARSPMPALLGLAAAAGLLAGGVPVLILALRKAPPPPAPPAVVETRSDEEVLRERAERGDARAMVALGRGLFQGTWGARDLKAAEAWLGEAMNSSDAAAADEGARVLDEMRRFVRTTRFEREAEAASGRDERPPAPPAPPPAPAPAATPPTPQDRSSLPPTPDERVAGAPADEPAPASAPTPKAGDTAVAGAATPSPAPTRDEDEPDAAPDDEPSAADAGPARDPAQVAALEREVQRRAAAWYKARDADLLTCRDCQGKKELGCKRCGGAARVACPQCGGQGSIQVTEAVPGRSMTGVRTVRRKVDCPGCERGSVACRCGDGLATCDCARDHDGALGGYRELTCRRAFWDHVSPTARRGRKPDLYLLALVRGEVLQEHVGPAMRVAEATIEQVTIEADRALVVARVTYVKPDGEQVREVTTSEWVRERGRFYLRTPADASPERLLDRG
ncbi:MAG: hypothetical protein M9894_36630 [Planctomycetes bacterium]|nr:hypothetical protein [Planctomycetota bacterium]